MQKQDGMFLVVINTSAQNSAFSFKDYEHDHSRKTSLSFQTHFYVPKKKKKKRIKKNANEKSLMVLNHLSFEASCNRFGLFFLSMLLSIFFFINI